jgi:hypothetical protein
LKPYIAEGLAALPPEPPPKRNVASKTVAPNKKSMAKLAEAATPKKRGRPAKTR